MAWYLVASDNFNRANEEPLSGGGSWTGVTGSQITGQNDISSNQLIAHATSTDCASYYSGASWGDDQRSLGTYKNSAAAHYICPYVRLTATGGYRSIADSTAAQLYKWSSSTGWTALGSAYNSFGFSDIVFETTAVGTTIAHIRGGSQIGSATDATYSSGNAGIGGYSTVDTAYADDWEGYDTVAPAGGAPVMYIHYAFSRR